MLDVLIAGADRLLQQRHRAHDLSARAVAALVPVVLNKSRLHRMKISRLPQPFNGGNLIALMHHGKRQAAIHASAIDMYCARSTLPVIAAFFRTGQMNPLTQRIEQSSANIEATQRVVLAIHT